MQITQRIFLAALAALACASPCGAGAREIESYTEQLTRAACEMGRAYANRDIDTLDRLSADDYVQTDVRGGVLKRAEYFDFVRNRKSTLAVECDSVEVTLYGTAAVVTGGWTYTISRPQGVVVTHSRWTSVWTKYPTGWKRHAFQNTYVNPQADRNVIEASEASAGAQQASSGTERSSLTNACKEQTAH